MSDIEGRLKKLEDNSTGCAEYIMWGLFLLTSMVFWFFFWQTACFTKFAPQPKGMQVEEGKP